MTRSDLVLIFVLALVAVLALPLASALGEDGSQVVVTGPAGTTVVGAGGSRTLRVQGTGGEVVVRVDEGRARVTEADCPDQVCVKGGEIGSPGQSLVCLPNSVTVRIGGGGDAYDAVLR